MLNYVDADYILWAHLTNPFISTKKYQEALSLFLKNKKKFNSLFSTTIVKNHFWSNKKKPINHDPFSKKHIIATKLQPVFFQNGGIFIRKKSEMESDGRFVGSKPFMFPMDEITGWDLDYPWQMDVAKFLKNKKYAY
jgi:CMP-N-acetylneuraminic acid synthetase